MLLRSWLAMLHERSMHLTRHFVGGRRRAVRRPRRAAISGEFSLAERLESRCLLTTIDLAALLAGQGTTIFGADANDFSGRSVSSAGDVNGDGFDDLLIGACRADASGNGKTSAGDSYVIFGGTSLQPTIDLANLGGAGITIFGAEANDQSGISVSSAGDVNGDGFDDLLIGAHYADAPGIASSFAGKSYVIFGKADWSSTPTLDLSSLGSAGITIFGAGVGHFSGRRVSSAGDVNGDGFDDLLIGSQSDKSYVVFGKPDWSATPTLSLATINGVNGFTLLGNNDTSYNDTSGITSFDGTVSSAGDVNGDGFDDLLIGAYRSFGAQNHYGRAGRSFVVFGQSDWSSTPTIDLKTLNGINGITLGFGFEEGARSGYAVSGAGDVNGDGFDDLLIGAPGGGFSNYTPNAGKSFVVFGKADWSATSTVNLRPTSFNGMNGFTIFGVDAGDESGIAVSGAGDVNGDGFDDLFIGAAYADGSGNAKSNAGESYVIFGGASLPATINLATLGAAGITIFGVDADDRSGRSVSSAGDVNGDGFDDLLIGAFNGDASGNSKSYAGDSYVIFGGNFTASVTHAGTAAAETLTGNASANVINGAAGNDTLIGNGGADVIYGGEGDDVLAISDVSFQRLDGGNGSDTLRLDGSGLTLNLTTLADNKLTNFETIDIRGSGPNTLSLSVREVLNLTANSNPARTANTLTIRRDSDDTVNMGTGWTQGSNTTVSGVTYNIFTQGAATLRVSNQSPVCFDLDSSFGIDGIVTTDFTGRADGATSLVLQSDGRIVLGGSATGAGGREFAVARYNRDGSLDTGFGNGGRVTTAFASGNASFGFGIGGIAQQSDGKIVAAGVSGEGGGGDNFTLVRYNADGTLDTSFDSDGTVTTDIAGVDEAASDIAIDSNGKIIAVGIADRQGFAVARYNSDGSLDTSFDGDGKRTGPGTSVSTVLVQPDGKIVAGGNVYNGGYDFALARYNTDGSLDGTFNGGFVSLDFFGSSDDIASIARQHDGKIVAVGYAHSSANGTDIALARFNSDGTLDTSFGVNGKMTTAVAPGSGYDYGNAVTTQPDGKILVGGETTVGANRNFLLLRYNSNGTLDPTFGTGGIVQTNPSSGDDAILALALQSDGNLVVAGNAGGINGGDFAVARYKASACHPPVFTSSATPSVDENTTAVLTVTATDADLPAQTVTFSITGGEDQARFAITSGGVLTFVSAPDFEAPTDANTDNIYLVQVTADDGNGGTTVQNIAVTVTAVNDAPVNSVPGALTTDEDITLVFSSGNSNGISIADIDAGSSSVNVSLSVTNGLLTLGGTNGLSFSVGDGTSDVTMVFTGTVSAINTALNGSIYAPVANFNGSATLTITTDDQGNTGSGGALSDIDPVAITVLAVNDAPSVAVDSGSVTVNEGQSASNSGSWSDIDTDDVVAITASVGSVTKNANGTWNWNFSTTDGPRETQTVTITANDGNGGVSTVTFGLTVGNVAPTAVDDAFSAFEDGLAQALNLLANDSDPAGANDPLTITGINTTGTVGEVTFASGVVSYSPNSQFESLGAGNSVVDSFTYSISDGDGGTATATVTVTITGENDAPTASGTLADVTVNQNAANTVVNLAGKFSDVDANDTLTITAFSSSGGLVTTSVSGNSLTLDYQANQSGSATITVTATDRLGASVSLTFLVTVRSPGQQANSIIAVILQWKADGKISADIADSMIVKVGNSIKSYEKGNISAAKGLLRALKNQIHAKVKPGGLTTADATLSIGLIDALIDSLTA